ncbi:hypothetical protein Taro_016441, partial [Colocasia esculenta]|nr:hypothetical protein [Colocasia esculenta]
AYSHPTWVGITVPGGSGSLQSISFATHQSRLESYSQQMTEKYAGEEE